MSRYRKIDVRIWHDEKFRAFTRPEPNAQTLWFFLLSGPMTTSVPGLYSAGELELAERLGWPVEAFRKAFAEVSSVGLVEADWEARLVWVRNAIRYDPPASPNVVTSWRIVADELPECALKRKALAHLRDTLDRQAFAEAFAKAFPESRTRTKTRVQNQKTSSSARGPESTPEKPEEEVRNERPPVADLPPPIDLEAPPRPPEQDGELLGWNVNDGEGWWAWHEAIRARDGLGPEKRRPKNYATWFVEALAEIGGNGGGGVYLCDAYEKYLHDEAFRVKGWPLPIFMSPNVYRPRLGDRPVRRRY